MSKNASSLLVQPRAHAPIDVRNDPFESHFESTSSESGAIRERVYGAIYRDGEGRMRIEYRFFSGEQTSIISDPIAGNLFFLDDVAHRVQQEPGGSSQGGWAFANCLPVYTAEYKVINGLLCRRVLLKDTITRSDAGETWFSEERYIVMKDVGVVHGVVNDWHVTQLEFAEPESALFEAPGHYRSV